MNDTSADVGVVELLRRYPIKSMLGEPVASLEVLSRGVAGDRMWAVFDESTGKIASAKRPKLWRDLLRCQARTYEPTGNGARGVEITLPNGTVRHAGDPKLNDDLSDLVKRRVRLIDVPPSGAAIDRSYPEVVLAEGLGKDVDYSILTLGQGAPPGTFLDYAALHLIPTATLDGIAALVPGGAIETVRYRPNVVIRSPQGTPPFSENDWRDTLIRIGEEVILRTILLTPRCSIPMLAHGTLPPRPEALRVIVEQNRVEIPEFGNQPCAGVYVAVEHEGTIRAGDPVAVSPRT